MDDAGVARAFQEHESWAFDEVYGRHGRLLFSVALRVLRSVEDAEDCVHDVLVRIWKNPQLFHEERGSLRAFLVTCVRNEALYHLRSAGRRNALSARSAQNAQFSETFEIEDFVEHARLREALSQLPDDQRRALGLAYFGGKTHVEVAQALEEPLGTVKSRIALGLRKLNAALSARARV